MYHLCQNVQEIFVIFLKSQKITSVLSIFVVKVYETLTPKCPVFMPSDYKRELLTEHISMTLTMDCLYFSGNPGGKLKSIRIFWHVFPCSSNPQLIVKDILFVAIF